MKVVCSAEEEKEEKKLVIALNSARIRQTRALKTSETSIKAEVLCNKHQKLIKKLKFRFLDLVFKSINCKQDLIKEYYFKV